MKTRGLITPDKIKVADTEIKPFQRVPQSDSPEQVVLTLEEEREALENLIEIRKLRLEELSLAIEEKEALAGRMPESTKAKNAWKYGVGMGIGAVAGFALNFLKGCA